MFKSMCEIKPTDKMDKLRAVTTVRVFFLVLVVIVFLLLLLLSEFGSKYYSLNLNWPKYTEQ